MIRKINTCETRKQFKSIRHVDTVKFNVFEAMAIDKERIAYARSHMPSYNNRYRSPSISQSRVGVDRDDRTY